LGRSAAKTTVAAKRLGHKQIRSSKAKASEPTSAHSATQIADAKRAIPLTDHLAAPSQRDAVTLALAAVTEAPPPENPPPRTRLVLKIVGDVIDAIVPTSMREWLFNEHPMDYEASKPS